MANVVTDRIHHSINHINLHGQKQSKPNLTLIESQGYNWLLKKTSNLHIVVCEGGAKLIVSPALIDKKIKEKVNNPDFYVECEIDPRKSLHDLLNIWMIGKQMKLLVSIMHIKLLASVPIITKVPSATSGLAFPTSHLP